MLGLLLRAISIIAEIFVLISHLQRLSSMFERMSIFFDRKMTAFSAAKEIFFQAHISYFIYFILTFNSFKEGCPSTSWFSRGPPIKTLITI